MTYDINSNILSNCGLSAEQLAEAVKAVRPDNGFTGVQMFLDAEAKYGLNALFILAHAAIESAWATSYFARTRNNLFGFNAVDSNPDEASSYPSQAACVDFYAGFIKEYYLTPGAVYYNGATPHGIFVKYSSSHDTEAQSVVGVMNLLLSHLTPVQAASAPTPAPSPAPVNASRYTVQEGDTLWAIANAHGLSLARLLQLNPQIADPNVIHPGDVVNVSGNRPETQTYTVQEGDTLSGIASKFGTSWQAVYNANRGVIGDNPDLIKPGEVLSI